MTYLIDSPNRIRLFNPTTTYFLGLAKIRVGFQQFSYFLFRAYYANPFLVRIWPKYVL